MEAPNPELRNNTCTKDYTMVRLGREVTCTGQETENREGERERDAIRKLRYAARENKLTVSRLPIYRHRECASEQFVLAWRSTRTKRYRERGEARRHQLRFPYRYSTSSVIHICSDTRLAFYPGASLPCAFRTFDRMAASCCRYMTGRIRSRLEDREKVRARI